MAVDNDGHWWNAPFGLTMILREQGVLDEDEFVHEPKPSIMRTCELCFEETDDVELVQSEIEIVRVFVCARC